MEIKEYQDKYHGELSEIYLESRKSTFTWLDTSAFSTSDFNKDTQGERILVAFSGGQMVGFISIWEPENFIHHLYVSTDSHSQGIGSELLKSVKSTYEDLSLKCMVNNKAAIRFYESKGFARESKERDSQGEYYLMKYRTKNG
ncbi:GNAT family N-acetyltransferase [Vibrio profundum]|uniref:GNAT family N-acetyltransferase n=1 Tax=Vibrio profundum TaxID=2910247 RepID=UPI003D0B7A25